MTQAANLAEARSLRNCTLCAISRQAGLEAGAREGQKKKCWTLHFFVDTCENLLDTACMFVTPVIAKCKFGCRVPVNVETDAAGMVAIVYNDIRTMQPETFARPTELLQAIPHLVWCRAHGQPMQGKRLRVTRSDEPCSDVCRMATGATCKCSCGGLNHGMDAR